MRSILTLAVLLFPASAWAGSASLDCVSPRRPIEALICADGGLLTMHERLTSIIEEQRERLPATQARALVHQQREWLRRRDSACPLPTQSDDGFTPEQIWRSAPCVAGQYRQRLSALGEPLSKPAAPPSGFIHPLCLALAASETASPQGIPLNLCNRGNAHVAVLEDGHDLSAQGTRYSSLPAYARYRRLGRIADGREVYDLSVNYGGTGHFASIIAARRQIADTGEERLVTTVLHAGGDRCNLGIVGTQLTDGTLWVVHAATPADLASPEPGKHYDPFSGKLTSCAICCIGTLTYAHPIGEMEELVSARISNAEELAALAGQHAPHADRCMAQAIRATAPELPHDYSPTALREMIDMTRRCTDQGSP
jgi:uncharacterized protein YecT (DUF1311 family)